MYACWKISLVAATLISTSMVADAADVRRPPIRSQLATIYDWTGFYAGGHVGVGWANDNDSGIFAGGQVGFNYQVGHWVLGVEGDLSATSTDINWTSTLAARVGWAFDRWLVYGKVGGAWANIDAAPVSNSVRESSDRSTSGLLVGVGAEYALQNNWTAKVEYNMMDIDDKAHVFKLGLNYRFGLGPLPRR